MADTASSALVGFLLSLTPLSCDLMGWRGAGGNGAADIGTNNLQRRSIGRNQLTARQGVYFFFGGLLMIIGSVGEWIIGNTFPFVVFGTFGAFWLAFGSTLQPFYNAYGAYVTDPTVAAQSMGQPGNSAGLATPAFNASFAFFLLFMGLICLIFLICSLRTNVVFFIIFLTLVGAFGCLAGAYWNLALAYENAANVSAAAKASKLVVVSTSLSNARCR